MKSTTRVPVLLQIPSPTLHSLHEDRNPRPGNDNITVVENFSASARSKKRKLAKRRAAENRKLLQYRINFTDSELEKYAADTNNIDMFVGVKSGNGEYYFQRRLEWRTKCSAKYAKAGIKYRFMIGVPIEKGHDLGGTTATLDTLQEQQLSVSAKETNNETDV